MNKGSISGENRRFDRQAFAVEGAPIERNVNDIFEVQINCVGCNCVGKSIKWLLQRGFEFSDHSYDFVNSRLVYQTVRSINEQTDVFVKLDVSRKFYVVHANDLYSCQCSRSCVVSLCFAFMFTFCSYSDLRRRWALPPAVRAGHRAIVRLPYDLGIPGL